MYLNLLARRPQKEDGHCPVTKKVLSTDDSCCCGRGGGLYDGNRLYDAIQELFKAGRLFYGTPSFSFVHFSSMHLSRSLY